ncbi:alcohol dehydrogenase [Algihabitans albus]|uniref:alcohol dehydrogenase n=1 Tax=Algihabitans albus TaxID=2164067 RepID=UPI000E5D2C80|nr:alcohol dehydrogenase [Algihabitans albus]
MKAWSVTEFGAPLERLERETPQPAATQVLVRVSHCGVCHTDLHLWQGYYDIGGGKKLELASRGVTLPATLGHEIFGEVVAVGPEGDQGAIGRQGVVFPWTGCGACPACAAEDEHLCVAPRYLGVFTPGGYGDHVLLPDSRYLVPAPGVEPALAATYACSGLTAFAALRKAEPFGTDTPLVLIGAGGVGLTAIALLVAQGLKSFTVVDIDDAALAAARALGAPATVNSMASDDPIDSVKRAAGGAPATIVDFVGNEATSGLALDLLRKGGAYVLVGLFGGALHLPLPSLPIRVLRIEGSYIGNRALFGELMQLVASGRVPPIPIEERPWSNCTEALRSLERREIRGRVVLRLDG